MSNGDNPSRPPALTKPERDLLNALVKACEQEDKGGVVRHDAHWCVTQLDGRFNLLNVVRRAGLIK